MKIVATIEARMRSTRLPGKSMKKILDKPMLELMIERVEKAKYIDKIMVATSENPEDDVIEELTKKMKVGCFRGSEVDVLDRVLKTAKSVNADVILELWGDSPLIDSKILDDIIDYYLKNEFDCIGTFLPNYKKTYPIGISALIFSTKILEEVEKTTQNPDDRENVSNYIYEHPEKYKIAIMPCPKELNFPDIRLTVDEERDFKVVKTIFENLYPINSNFSTIDAIRFVNANPDLRDINKNVIQKRLASWDKL